MTAPKLQQYPTRHDRQRNFPTNTGVVASFTIGKGWQASGFNLPIPAALSGAVAEAK